MQHRDIDEILNFLIRDLSVLNVGNMQNQVTVTIRLLERVIVIEKKINDSIESRNSAEENEGGLNFSSIH